MVRLCAACRAAAQGRRGGGRCWPRGQLERPSSVWACHWALARTSRDPLCTPCLASRARPRLHSLWCPRARARVRSSRAPVGAPPRGDGRPRHGEPQRARQLAAVGSLSLLTRAPLPSWALPPHTPAPLPSALARAPPPPCMRQARGNTPSRPWPQCRGAPRFGSGSSVGSAC